jgi:hypothetical protein
MVSPSNETSTISCIDAASPLKVGATVDEKTPAMCG